MLSISNRIMYTIAGILIVLWLLGLLMSWGGMWIHILLVIAVILILVFM